MVYISVSLHEMFLSYSLSFSLSLSLSLSLSHIHLKTHTHSLSINLSFYSKRHMKFFMARAVPFLRPALQLLFLLYLIFSSYFFVILKVNTYFDLYYCPRNSVARKHIHFKYISVSILINKMLIFLISYASDVNFYAINKTKSCGIMIKILKHIHFSILSHIKSRKL